MTNLSKITTWLLCLTIFLIPFYFFRFKILGLPTNILELSVLILTLLVAVNLFISGRRWRFGSVLPCLFVLVAFAAVYLAEDRTRALGQAKGWFLIPVMFYWSLINTISRENLKKLSVPVFISLMIISVWAILQKAGVITTLFYQTSDNSFYQYLVGNFRVFGPFESPNYLAMFLVPMGFLSLPIFDLIKTRVAKIILGLLYLLPFLSILYSGSRGGVIALIVSLLIYLYVTKTGSIHSKTLSISLSVMALVAGILFLYRYGFNPESDSIRLDIYHYAGQLLQASWFCGIGLGEFQDKIATLSQNAESFKTFALPYAIHPHNVYLAVWLNLGLAGIIVFAGIIIDFLKKMFQADRNSLIFAGAFMAMLAILIHGLFDTTYFKNDLSMIFWLIVAIATVNRKVRLTKQD